MLRQQPSGDTANAAAFIDLHTLPPYHACGMIGETIAYYRIVERLGGGGMGVYKAEDTKRKNQWTER